MDDMTTRELFDIINDLSGALEDLYEYTSGTTIYNDGGPHPAEHQFDNARKAWRAGDVLWHLAQRSYETGEDLVFTK